MYPTFSAAIFVLIIRLIFCEDKCGQPNKVERASISNPSDVGYDLESTVAYKCDYGFVHRGAFATSRCIRDRTTGQPVWTKPGFTCNPRSCGDPGSVENAQRVGSRFTFPNNVTYVCNEGYRISGNPRRFCEASGVWSGRLPSCHPITCGRPEDIENGRAVYASLTYNSELRYECNQDLQLSSKKPRYCGQDGQWTGIKPICREVECEMPDALEFGTAELVGGRPKVESIVIYKCDPGRTLVGSGTSKCLKSGEWTFPTPLCVEPCIAPDVDNGELGKLVQEHSWRYGWRTVFEKVSAGTTLDDNEELILKCNGNYVPKSQPFREVTITCRAGKLSPEPECVATTCLGDPPSIENGKAVVRKRDHGYVIWYTCDKGFDKGPDGKIECVYGSWVGYTPTCIDTRCDKSSLNYPGLVRSEGFVFNGRSFEPTCRSGYEVTENADKKIYCNKGTWSGNLPPCTTGQCKTEDLLGFSGLVLNDNRNLDEGEFFQPQCSEGFEFSNKQDSRLFCHKGEWSGNLPPCSPAHCSSNPPVPENGKIKSFRAISHGSLVEYECLPTFKISGKSTVTCNHGQWAGSAPTCKDTRCYLKDLTSKDGVDLTDDSPIPSSTQKVNIACTRGFTLKYSNVYCEDGEWKTENLLSPCQEDECEVKRISNGEVLKERRVPIRDFWGRQTGTDTVREEADIGSIERSEAILYVECNGQYRFQGDEEIEGQVSIMCRRGEWTPLPLCLLPGELMGSEKPEAAEDVINVPALKEHRTNHSIGINDRKPYASNASVEEDRNSGDAILGNNSTESEDTVTTDAPVNPPCSCKYVVRDSVLLAHDGKKIVKYLDEIPRGSSIAFYCNNTGIYRLRGSPSLTCPSDCNWHSSAFPTCVGPSDEDVIIRVFAHPSYNMRVGLGGVLSVIPGTRLELTCRSQKGYRQHVDWTAPQGSGFRQTETDRGVFRMKYIVSRASSQDNGKYTCSKSGGAFRTVDIEVGDVECPEIESTADMAVSYAPNRKFGGRATFHCFAPSTRKGPSYVICEASGLWSGPPSYCYLPTCPIGSLYDVVPEGVVALIDEDIKENVSFGYEVKLGCDEKGKVLKGVKTAVCGTGGNWRTAGNLQCTRGCGSLSKKNDSTLLISPDKEFYSMGESITFSCPEGKDLTGDVQRILCFSSGWTPNIIPDCQ